jgi:cytokinin dehydrogenase
VVTGAGDRVRCSAREHPDLFDAVRAGLGQVAVITSVTLALAPAPRSVRSTVLEHEDVTTMLAGIRALTRGRRVDVAQGAIVARPTGGWVFRTATAVFDADDGGGHAAPADQQTTTYVDFLDRLSGFEAVLRAAGQWELPHPWLTTFVGDHAVASALSEELADLSSHDLGPAGQVVVNPVLPERVRTPLVQLPAGSLCFTVNLIRVPTGDDPDQIGRLLEANRAIYDRLRARGGTLYPASALQMSSAHWRRHFGPAFDRLDDARRTYDPDGLLTPGYEVFSERR